MLYIFHYKCFDDILFSLFTLVSHSCQKQNKTSRCNLGSTYTPQIVTASFFFY